MQALSFRTARVATHATKSTKKVAGTERLGGAGYRKYDGDALWLPAISRPEWLDGTLPGDRGFDPLGLSKPDVFVAIGEQQAPSSPAMRRHGAASSGQQAAQGLART